MIEMRQEVDLLRHEVGSRLERDRGLLIRDEDEAENMLRRFMDIGMPRSVIVREMAKRGAPSSWVERLLDELFPATPVLLQPRGLSHPKRRHNESHLRVLLKQPLTKR